MKKIKSFDPNVIYTSDNIYTDKDGYQFEIIPYSTKIKKPIYGKREFIRYSDVLIYLLHVINGDDAIYNLLLSLANYAIHHNGNLTPKQSKMLDDFIEQYKKAGIL